MKSENKTHRLYWLGQSGRRVPAGVAFYNDENGDYRLKIDVMNSDKSVFLKPVAVQDSNIEFRVEMLLKSKSTSTQRVEIGYGQADAKVGYPIMINLGPFDRTLVLEAA